MSVASFIASQRAEHDVSHAKCCQFLGVSESWFYKWRDRQPTPREARRAVPRFIDRYNTTRRHSACEMHSPLEYERILAERVSEDGKAAWSSLQDCLKGPQRRRLVSECRAMTCSTDYRTSLHDFGGSPVSGRQTGCVQAGGTVV
jgi:hypothetical protein